METKQAGNRRVMVEISGEFKAGQMQRELQAQVAKGYRLSDLVSSLQWKINGVLTSGKIGGYNSITEQEDIDTLCPLKAFIEERRNNDREVIGLSIPNQFLYEAIQNASGLDWVRQFASRKDSNESSVKSSQKQDIQERDEDLARGVEHITSAVKCMSLDKQTVGEKFESINADQNLTKMAEEINTKLLSDLLREVDTNQLLTSLVGTEKKLDAEEVWGDASSDVKTDYVKPAAAIESNTDQVQLQYPPSEQVDGGANNNQEEPQSSIVQQQHPSYYASHSQDRSRSRSPKQSSHHVQDGYNHERSTNNNQGWEKHNGYKNKGGESDKDDGSPQCFYIRLRGLPYNARENELFEFLGFKIDKECLAFRHDSMGRFCGEGMIKCTDKSQFDTIIAMHMRNMGRRYIEVFPGDKLDFQRAWDSQNLDLQPEEQVGGSSSNGNDDRGNEPLFDSEFLQSIGIVKIRGLPYEATDSDITQFFQESQIIPNGIQKVYDGRRPTGEAFVLFATKDDASKALQKDKQRLGSRYIETFLCHPKEYTNHIRNAKQMGTYGTQSSFQGNRYPDRHDRQNRYGGNHGGYNNSYRGGYGGSKYNDGHGYQGNQAGGGYQQGYRGDHHRSNYYGGRDDSRYQPYQQGGYNNHQQSSHYNQPYSYNNRSYQREQYAEQSQPYYYGNNGPTQTQQQQNQYNYQPYYGASANNAGSQQYMGMSHAEQIAPQTTQPIYSSQYYPQTAGIQNDATSGMPGYHATNPMPQAQQTTSYYQTSDSYPSAPRTYQQ